MNREDAFTTIQIVLENKMDELSTKIMTLNYDYQKNSRAIDQGKRYLTRIIESLKVIKTLQRKTLNCRCEDWKDFHGKYSNGVGELHEEVILPTHLYEDHYDFKFCPFCGRVLGLLRAELREVIET